MWVVDFPLFEAIDDDGRPVPAHHPFTMPHPDDLDRLEADPLSVRLAGLRPRAQRVGAGFGQRPNPPRRHPAARSSRCSASIRRQAAGTLRVPARRVPLRRAAARRLRVRHRPPGRHPRRRGEHPRGHRLPEDAVGRRPAHRRAAPIDPSASSRELGLRLLPPTSLIATRMPKRSTCSSAAAGGAAAQAGAAGRPHAADDARRVVGQEHLLGAGQAAAGADRERPAVARSILWGRRAPARRRWPVSSRARRRKAFEPLSAVTAGVKDVREVVERARAAARRARPGHDPVPRRGAPLQQGAAGRAAAAVEDGTARARSARRPRTRSSRSTRRCSSRSTLFRLEPLDDDGARARWSTAGLDAEGATADDDAVDQPRRPASTGDGRARARPSLEVGVARSTARRRARVHARGCRGGARRHARSATAATSTTTSSARSSRASAAPTPTPASTGWPACSRRARTPASSPAAW